MKLKSFIWALLCILLAASPAGSGSMLLTGVGPPPVVAGGATTTWDPANKNVAFTLSGGNLIATVGGAGGAYVSLRAIASHSSGKFYYEATLTGVVNNANPLIGVANSTESFTGFCGQSTNSIGWQTLNGNVFINGSPVATIQSAVQGDIAGIAVDYGNSTIWFRTNNGNWNNSGTANPATNTGGISIAGLAAGPYFPFATMHDNGDVWTANFGSAYANPAPSGFGNQ